MYDDPTYDHEVLFEDISFEIQHLSDTELLALGWRQQLFDFVESGNNDLLELAAGKTLEQLREALVDLKFNRALDHRADAEDYLFDRARDR